MQINSVLNILYTFDIVKYNTLFKQNTFKCVSLTIYIYIYKLTSNYLIHPVKSYSNRIQFNTMDNFYFYYFVIITLYLHYINLSF